VLAYHPPENVKTKATPLPTLKPTVKATPQPTVTATPVKPVVNATATPEPTPEPTAQAQVQQPATYGTTSAGHPIVDPTAMHGGVVVITPTPTPVNKKILVDVTLPSNRIEINKYTDFNVYIKTHDKGYKNVTLRFNVSWNSAVNNADWVWLGYFPIQHYELNLPAHAQQTKQVSIYIPERLPGSNMVIGPGVYRVTLDVLSEDDSDVIGSDTINRIDVVNYNETAGGYVYH
jgi:hypothetical protein